MRSASSGRPKIGKIVSSSVPGGGVALIRTQKAVEKVEAANEDQAFGVRILARAIEEPLRQIVANAGEDAAVLFGLSQAAIAA